jgi:fluoride exporter
VTALVVLLGGAIGGPTRYLLDSYVKSRTRSPFPFGTLAVNVIGCLILGLVAGWLSSGDFSKTTYALVGTGFCGGLTTFSAFSVESIELIQGRRSASAVGYVLVSCVLGIGAAALGYAVV